MDSLVNLTEWCRQERQRMSKQLAALESGRCRIGEDRGHGWIDLSKENIARIKLHIAELDEILAQYEAERVRIWNGSVEGSEARSQSAPAARG